MKYSINFSPRIKSIFELQICEDPDILFHISSLGVPKIAMKYVKGGESTRERIDCGKLIVQLLKYESTFPVLISCGGLSGIAQMVGLYDKSVELAKLGIDAIHIL